MSELVFLLEEPSARAMLEGLLPRLLPNGLPVRYIVFEGKSDLEAQLVRRLQHYRVPDALANAAAELATLTGHRYQKVGGSRAIGLYLDTDNIRSQSFAVFVAGIKRLTTER